MHELSVTESILNISLDHAKKAEATRVTDIYLVIGRLSSLVDDSIQFYWDMISEGTMCEGATLHFDRRPARIFCIECSKEYDLGDELAPCPACGSDHIQVISGEQFYLDSIEVIQDAPVAES
jgi:hydrogenase nickel incorporation protein HypA/HybF